MIKTNRFKNKGKSVSIQKTIQIISNNKDILIPSRLFAMPRQHSSEYASHSVRNTWCIMVGFAVLCTMAVLQCYHTCVFLVKIRIDYLRVLCVSVIEPIIEGGIHRKRGPTNVPDQCHISLGWARQDADHKTALRYSDSSHIFEYERIYEESGG